VLESLSIALINTSLTCPLSMLKHPSVFNGCKATGSRRSRLRPSEGAKLELAELLYEPLLLRPLLTLFSNTFLVPSLNVLLLTFYGFDTSSKSLFFLLDPFHSTATFFLTLNSFYELLVLLNSPSSIFDSFIVVIFFTFMLSSNGANGCLLNDGSIDV
jgi:hypothetical protein